MAKKVQQKTLPILTIAIIAVVLVWAGAVSYWWVKRSACPDLSGWGAGEKKSLLNRSQRSTLLTGVTTANWNCYERIAINLGDANTSYFVRYVNDVVTEGQGASVSLAGNAKIQITLGATTYNSETDNWYDVYKANSDRTLPGVNLNGYSSLKDAKFAGSFEGQSTFGLGVKEKLPFRVISEGNQLFIDIAHK